MSLEAEPSVFKGLITPNDSKRGSGSCVEGLYWFLTLTYTPSKSGSFAGSDADSHKKIKWVYDPFPALQLAIPLMLPLSLGVNRP